MPSSPPLWKISVTVTKDEAADVAAAIELASNPQVVMSLEEPFKEQASIEALYGEMPNGALLSQIVGRSVNVPPLPDQDWIKLSQEGLPPVRAGRFFVYGAHDKGRVPHGVIALRIEAGLAFGTGHHETTALCLAVLSDLAKGKRFACVADIGCGTGLLAIGAAKLWKRSVIASDIDPVAVAVWTATAFAHAVGPLVRTVAADGLVNPAIAAMAPFDLIFANILAGPLTRWAPEIAGALKPRGMAVLSGLLRWQENLVASFYRPRG